MTDQPNDEWAVTWRTEDGAEGPLLIPTVKDRDVACVAVDVRLEVRRIVTYGKNYHNAACLDNETSARGFIENNAKRLYEMVTE